MSFGGNMWLREFWRQEDGQDIIEYSLLITFIGIACMWFLNAGQPAVNAIWTTGNERLAAANTSAS